MTSADTLSCILAALILTVGGLLPTAAEEECKRDHDPEGTNDWLIQASINTHDMENFAFELELHHNESFQTLINFSYHNKNEGLVMVKVSAAGPVSSSSASGTSEMANLTDLSGSSSSTALLALFSSISTSVLKLKPQEQHLDLTVTAPVKKVNYTTHFTLPYPQQLRVHRVTSTCFDPRVVDITLQCMEEKRPKQPSDRVVSPSGKNNEAAEDGTSQGPWVFVFCVVIFVLVIIACLTIIAYRYQRSLVKTQLQLYEESHASRGDRNGQSVTEQGCSSVSSQGNSEETSLSNVQVTTPSNLDQAAGRSHLDSVQYSKIIGSAFVGPYIGETGERETNLCEPLIIRSHQNSPRSHQNSPRSHQNSPRPHRSHVSHLQSSQPCLRSLHPETHSPALFRSNNSRFTQTGSHSPPGHLRPNVILPSQSRSTQTRLTESGPKHKENPYIIYPPLDNAATR